MAIALDAMSVGKFNDDRPPTGAATRLHADYARKKAPPLTRSEYIARLNSGWDGKR
jgi:hypothetical protein